MIKWSNSSLLSIKCLKIYFLKLVRVGCLKGSLHYYVFECIFVSELTNWAAGSVFVIRNVTDSSQNLTSQFMSQKGEGVLKGWAHHKNLLPNRGGGGGCY